MAVKEGKKNEEKKHLMEESFGQDTVRKEYQDRLIGIREKKLKQLRFVIFIHSLFAKECQRL
jgi:hypothetical protein